MDELIRLKDIYFAMPHGPARAHAIQEAVRRADELGDQGWSLSNRYNLAIELSMYGDPAKVLPLIAEYTARVEELYLNTGRPMPDKRIDQYLYMLSLGVGVWSQLPQLPLDQWEQLMKQFGDSLQRYRYGKAEYYREQYFQSLYEGKSEAAEAAFQAWQADITSGTMQVITCEGCHQKFRVDHAAELGDWEGALREARPLLDGTLACKQNPWNVLCLLMELSRDRGDRAGVKRYGGQLARRAEWDEAADMVELLPYDMLFNLPRGLRTLEQTLDDQLQSWSQDAKLDYFCDVWLLLTLAARERKTVSLALPQRFPLYRPDGTYHPAELAEWFRQQALDIARRFDRRNGYPYFQKQIETTWAGLRKAAGMGP